MLIKSRRSLHFAILASIPVLVFVVALPFILNTGSDFRATYNSILTQALNLGAAGMLFAAARRTARHSRALGRAWYLLASAQLFYFTGDLIFMLLEMTFHEVPYPSVADGFFLVSYLLFLAGIVWMPGAPMQQKEKIYNGLQAAIVMLSSALFMWYFVVAPLAARTGSGDPWLLAFSVAYPVFDLLLLLAAVLLIFRRNTSAYPVALFLLVAGGLLTVVADTIYSYQSIEHTYTSSNSLDLAFAISFLLSGLAGLSQFLHPTGDAAQLHPGIQKIIRKSVEMARSLLPSLWLVAVFLLLAGNPSPKGSMPLVTLIGWTAAILALTVMMQVAAASEHTRLNADLRDLNEELEARVEERTRALEDSNRDLTVEMQQREQITMELRLSHELYRAMVEDLPVLICRFLPGGVLSFVNRAYCDYFGKTREELTGAVFYDLIPDSDRKWARQQIESLTREDAVISYEHRVIAADGSIRWQRWIDRAVFDGDVLVEYQSIGVDTTEQHLAEQALRESEEKFRDLFDNSTDLIQLVSPDGRIIFVNNAWKKKMGYSDQELAQLELWSILAPDCKEHCRAHFEQVLAGERLEGLQAVFINRAGKPVYLEGNLNCSINNGMPEYIRCIFHDISERRKAEELLIQQAYHDPLTGLPNRSLLVNRLRQSILRMSEEWGYHCSLLFLDLDNFKVINDSLGHTSGDELLITVAEHLAGCVRGEDLVARLGGDEFVILLEGIDSEAYVIGVAQRVQEDLKQRILLNGNPASLSVSIGIVMAEHLQDAEGALRDADIAMYHAKDLGRDRFMVFEPEMRAKPAERLALQNDLRMALSRDELFLVYQPVYHLETGRIRGWEALLRWRHPRRGIVSPSAFISLAEETGLIVPVGAWVLKQACRQMKAWMDARPGEDLGVMSVNVSIKQLEQPGFAETVRQVLDEVGLAASCLALELTEGVVMENIQRANEILQEIHRLGIQIYIDDFGTGYSSLARLQHLPIQIIKVDRNFLAQMDEDGGNAEILRAIVVLGHELGLKIIAEGIEKAYQSEYLQRLGCTLGQGFFLSVPLTAEEMEEKIFSREPVIQCSEYTGSV